LITEIRSQALRKQCAVLGLVPSTSCLAALGLGIPLSKVGFPIRKSADQSFFAAPHGLSQRSTSFIASQRQGIHRMPLRHLIALIINAHPARQRPRAIVHANLRSSNSSSGQTLILKDQLVFGPFRRRAVKQPTWHRRIRQRRISSAATHPIDARSSAPRATCVTTRCSERSYLFTMSDIAQPIPGQSARGRLRKHFSADKQNPGWWSQTGSNRRPPACKAGALPTELWPPQGSEDQQSEIRHHKRRAPSDA
jgi:hypothetical protein